MPQHHARHLQAELAADMRSGVITKLVGMPAMGFTPRIGAVGAQVVIDAVKGDDALAGVLVETVLGNAAVKFGHGQPPRKRKTVCTVFLPSLEPHCPTHAGTQPMHSAGLMVLGDTGFEPVTSCVSWRLIAQRKSGKKASETGTVMRLFANCKAGENAMAHGLKNAVSQFEVVKSGQLFGASVRHRFCHKSRWHSRQILAAVAPLPLVAMPAAPSTSGLSVGPIATEAGRRGIETVSQACRP